MRPTKVIAAATVSSLVVVLSYGCSTPAPVGGELDAGADVQPDKVVVHPPDANHDGDSFPPPTACGPVDTTGYTPRAYSPPSGKHQNKCTTQNLTDYVSCITGADKTKCAQFGMGMAAATCGACIETQATDATWGPLVSPDGKVLSFNVPGCLDLVVKNTQCGKSLDASYGCQDAACSACDTTTSPTFSTCVTSSLKKQCKTYGDTVTTACDAQFGDAAPAEISNCFPDNSIADPKAQQSVWIGRIATYFCGP